MEVDGEPTNAGPAITELDVEGMRCDSCVALVEETLVEDLGVLGAAVELASARATATYDPRAHSVGDLCAAVVAAGYVARRAHDAVANRPPE